MCDYIVVQSQIVVYINLPVEVLNISRVQSLSRVGLYNNTRDQGLTLPKACIDIGQSEKTGGEY